MTETIRINQTRFFPCNLSATRTIDSKKNNETKKKTREARNSLQSDFNGRSDRKPRRLGRKNEVRVNSFLWMPPRLLFFSGRGSRQRLQCVPSRTSSSTVGEGEQRREVSGLVATTAVKQRTFVESVMLQDIGSAAYDGVAQGRAVRNHGHHGGVRAVIRCHLQRFIGVSQQNPAVPSAGRVQVGRGGQHLRRRRRFGMQVAHHK